MATCKDCRFYGVCILNRRSADANTVGCKIFEVGERDFVEVVRCKDCLWWKRKGLCPMPGYNGDSYCSYGERIEGE